MLFIFKGLLNPCNHANRCWVPLDACESGASKRYSGVDSIKWYCK